jgi:hypothetical protein
MVISSRYLHFLIHGKLPPRRSPRIRSPRKPATSWKYRAWIRSLPCAACGCEVGVQAAHTVNNGMRSKGSDFSCVPLCVPCHCEYDNGLRSKDLFEADHNLNLAELRHRLNFNWFAYSSEVK